MIVSPDYGPMAGLSVAVVNRAAGPAGRSFRALALGFTLAARGWAGSPRSTGPVSGR